jgi:uncharacterized protein YqfA (UPF0365 family)
MPRPYTPRSAFLLVAVGLLLVLLAGLAIATDQPIGVWNLALGAGMGVNLATVVMLGEVRKARRE